MLRIAILDDYQGVALDLGDWRTLGADVEAVSFRRHLATEADAVDALGDFDVLCLMRERMALSRNLLARLPRLKFVAVTGSHTQVIDKAACAERGIPVVLTSPAASFSAAEHTWALVLGLARHIAVEDANMRSGGWQTTVGRRLEGATLGLMGLGELGAKVASYGRVFGMRVVAWSTHLTAERAAACGAELVSKDALLRESDVVSIHLKLGDRTRGTFGEREFALMKSTAVLVNTSRGPIVEEIALINALRTKRIAAAALDVFDIEPLPADHPLRTLPNTLLTPHVGFVTEEGYRAFYAGLIKAVGDWMAQRPLTC